MLCSYMISPPSVSIRPRRNPPTYILAHWLFYETIQGTTLLFSSSPHALCSLLSLFPQKVFATPYHARRSRVGEIKLGMQNPTLVTHLESTLIERPASVDSKPLTQSLSPLDATFTENQGEGVQLLLTRNSWTPSPWFSVNVASKGLRDCVSGLESTLAGLSISVDSKWVTRVGFCMPSLISPTRLRRAW